MNPRAAGNPPFDAGALALFLVACIGGGAASGLATPPGEWYASLAKPAWTPPGWVFGPAWTLLYMLMALAAWQVWRRRSATDVRMPLALFAMQLALNLAWTPIFFGMQRPGLALVEIVLMLAVILATTASFVRVSRTATLLMLPYCAWVSFATALNWAIWRMN